MNACKVFLCALAALGAVCLVAAAEGGGGGGAGGGEGAKALPKPREASGVDLLAALRGRRSTRSFDAARAIPEDVLATVLWAADGVNRPNGKHTAPCAMGLRYMRIYVCRADGAYRYDQDAHALVRVSAEDLRPRIGRQKFMADAQAVLLIAGDLSGFAKRAARAGKARQREWCQATAGCIAQNVYLAAAAFKLGTVMAAGLNADAARKGLALGKDEIPLYIMPLGYPKAE